MGQKGSEAQINLLVDFRRRLGVAKGHRCDVLQDGHFNATVTAVLNPSAD
jgi:hypothetical protein